MLHGWFSAEISGRHTLDAYRRPYTLPTAPIYAILKGFQVCHAYIGYHFWARKGTKKTYKQWGSTPCNTQVIRRCFDIQASLGYTAPIFFD